MLEIDQHRNTLKDMKSQYSTLASFCDNVSKITTNEIFRTVESFAHTQHGTAPDGCLTGRASAGSESNM